MVNKKVIAFGLITASLLALYFKNKVDKVSKQYDRLTFLPTSLENLSLQWNDFKPTLSFTASFKISNPLSEPFSLNVGVAKLQRIIVYDKSGQALAVSTPNLGAIQIPAKGSYVLQKIPFTVDVQRLAINLINYKTLTKDSFTFQSIVSVLGAEYVLK